MSETKEVEERLRELELRMSEVSRKLDDVLNSTRDLQDKYNKLESAHAQDEKGRIKSEWNVFKLTIIIGSLIEAMTGLIISYLMKAYETIYFPAWFSRARTNLFITADTCLFRSWKTYRI
jgi:hypothetical protein